jgi:molybdopterin synthase sulfur carrier subunit
MTTVLLPRSLLSLFPGVARHQEVDGEDVAAVIAALDRRVPGLRDRLVGSGPRLRPHINVFVAGQQADLTTPVAPGDTVHVIPAVSGGGVRRLSPAAESERLRPAARQARRSSASSGSNEPIRSATASPPNERGALDR